jgi:glycosyltransferase involved in cell wall biosynthesis
LYHNKLITHDLGFFAVNRWRGTTWKSGTPRAKIVFVCNELGNFRHHREHLVRAAMAAGMHAVLLASAVGDTDGMDYEYRPTKIERFRFHPLLDFKLFLTVMRFLLIEKPRVLHLISIKPYLFGGLAAVAARMLGWRGNVVITVPGLGRLYDNNNTANSPVSSRLRRTIVEFFLRVVVRHARVTFETKHDSDFWITRGLVAPDQAIVTRGTGIDLARFSRKPSAGSEKSLRVLFASRLLRAKGLDVFLKAATLISDPEIEMQVAGFVENDPDAVPLGELQRNAHVKYLGGVRDMFALLGETDIVVLPSRYIEGVPRILIEAAACACLSIATRFAGSEMLIENGRTGLFLDPGDGDAQAAQLATLIGDMKRDRNQRHAIGENALAHVRSNGFSEKDVARDFLNLYTRA